MAGVEEFQPTKLSSWIAGGTLPLAAGATQLYEVLQKLGVTVELLSETPSRLALGSGVFSLCMVALNLSLLAHIRALDKSATLAPAPVPTPPPTKISLAAPHRLNDIEVDILKFLAGVKCSQTSELTKVLRKQRALVEFHLIELEKARHIYSTHSTLDSMWYIDQPGRRALVERGMLT